MHLFSLKGKVAIVTGGYGYLGHAFVEALQEAGATVVVGGRSYDKFERVFAGKERIVFFSMDISKTVQIRDCFRRVFDEYGHIDILVNNAIYLSGQFPEEITDDDLSYSFDGTLSSVFRCIREVIPYMKQAKGGNIVNIASMYGLVAPNFKVYDGACRKNFNPPQYGAAKAGIVQLTKFFAEYLIPYGIRVNSISPGPFPSIKVQEDQEFIKRLSESNPSGRIGNPEDLKGAIVYLTSNASRYVVGQNLHVDGGWTIW